MSTIIIFHFKAHNGTFKALECKEGKTIARQRKRSSFELLTLLLDIYPSKLHFCY